MPEIEKFMPRSLKFQRMARLPTFSLSVIQQMLIGSVMGGIFCSTLFHFKEDASQAAARIVRTEDQ
jgi:hypothetical protein